MYASNAFPNTTLRRVPHTLSRLTKAPSVANRTYLGSPHYINESHSTSRRCKINPLHSQNLIALRRYSSTSHPWTDYGGTPTPRSKAISPTYNVPVHVPDDQLGIIQKGSTAGDLLTQPALVVVRQLEMMNLFIGFEQANRYRILTPEGENLGYLLEEDLGFTNGVARQTFRTHRAFKCVIMDTEGNIILRIHRPFSVINSRIYISKDDPNEIIGEAQQEWHPWRRKYNLFQKRGDVFEQFAKVDSPFLSWSFMATTSDGQPMASVDRNFTGFGRELFTDTGHYNLRFDAVSQDPMIETSLQSTESQQNNVPTSAIAQNQRDKETKDVVSYTPPPLTLDQRAVLLASAVSIDFDYFTRHSSGLPLPMFPIMGGGDTAEGSESEPVVGAEENEGSEPDDRSVPGTSDGPWNNQGYPQDGQSSGSEQDIFDDPWGRQEFPPEEDFWGNQQDTGGGFGDWGDWTGGDGGDW